MSEREVLEALWARLHDGKDAYWCEWYASDGKNHEARYFLKKLDAEAYVDAGADPDTAAMLRDFEQRVVSIDGSVRLARNSRDKGVEE